MKRLISIAALMLVSLAAAAQGADELARKNALQRFDEGVVLVDKGQYEEARLKFVQAYAVIQKPALLFNLAVTETKTNHAPSAAAHFRKLLKDSSTPVNLRTKAEKLMSELGPTLARIVVRAPNGADVSIDGLIVGRAPLEDPIDVLPGAHDVGIRLEDRHMETRREARPGEEQQIELSFVEAAPSSTATIGDAGAPPPKGNDESVRPTTGYVVPIVIGGVGLASIATGAGLALASQGAHADAVTAGTSCASQNADACTRAASAKSRADTFAAVGVGGYIVGGVLVATSLITFFLWPKSIVHVDAAISPTGGAVNLNWSF